jgi:hypothetical protein
VKKNNKKYLAEKTGKPVTLFDVIKTISSLCASVALIYFACMQHELSEKQHTFEVLERFYDEWSSSDFRNIQQHIENKQESGILDKDMKRVCNFFEHIGIYEKKDVIKINEIYLMFGELPCKYWDKFENAIDKYREKPGKDSAYKHFENLCEKIEKKNQ